MSRILHLAAALYGKVMPLNPTEPIEEAALRGAQRLEEVALHYGLAKPEALEHQASPIPTATTALFAGVVDPERPQSASVVIDLPPGQEPTIVQQGAYRYRWHKGQLEFLQDGGSQWALAGEQLERHYFEIVYLCFRPGGEPRSDTAAFLEAIGAGLLERVLAQVEQEPATLHLLAEAVLAWQTTPNAATRLPVLQLLGGA